MNEALIRKFGNYARLSREDVGMLNELATEHVRTVDTREDLIHEGDKPEHVNVILTGWACRYKTLEDGRRQIIAFLLPGDLCDMNVFVLREMDHSIGALTPLRFIELHRDVFEGRLQRHPRVLQALWWDSLVNSSIQREWTVNLGKRTALERIGHLFCELHLRLASVGLTQDGSCELPVTQADIGDAAGLSTVHVNRTLQDLRGAKLISLRGRTLTILDSDRLKTLSFFSDNYLHLNREGRQIDANET